MHSQEKRIGGWSTAVNPYQSSGADAASDSPRNVAVFGFLALVLLLLTIYVASPGVVLLNDELQLLPTQGRIYSIEVNGEPVTKRKAIQNTVGLGLVISLVSVGLGIKAWINAAFNRRLNMKQLLNENGQAQDE